MSDIFPGAGDIRLPVNDALTFTPDSWTRSFADGLRTLAQEGAFDGATVCELGSGTGVIMAGLMAGLKHMHLQAPASYIGLDITTQAVQACRDLAARNEFEGQLSLFQSDLLCDVSQKDLNGVTHVIACIPQVAVDRSLEPREMGDYYRPPQDPAARVPEDDYGLGLLARALDQMRVKTPRASAVFNVGGRQGPLISKLFEDHGFPDHRIVTRAVIPNDPGTSVASFADWEERTGQQCFFYGDPEGKTPITAAEAEERRVTGGGVYHDLMVIEARPD